MRFRPKPLGYERFVSQPQSVLMLTSNFAANCLRIFINFKRYYLIFDQKRAGHFMTGLAAEAGTVY
jgi:hypothetical protein